MPSLAVLSRAQNALPDLAALPRSRPRGLYVHVPFCFHKCHYCDFYSITRQSPQRMERFVDLTLAEAALWRERSDLVLKPETVFFGGGTPSLLPPGAMSRLLEGLAERFDLTGVCEWTVEVNPATADLSYLRMMRAGGVNRISLGAQSFDRRELATLERHHDPADVPRALAWAREAGFERLSIDLIYGIPGQTPETWRQSLVEAVALGTRHLSCYGLTYEPNTPMAVRRRLGRVTPAAEEVELGMLWEARTRLAAAGMPAYEISNYAAAGEESLHNLGYWTGQNYIGLGPAAASHVEGRRWRNDPHLGRWEHQVQAGGLPAIEYEELTLGQRAGELAMLGLRLASGIDLDEIARRTRVDARSVFSDVLTRLIGAGLLEEAGGRIRLTDKGLPVGDGVASEFLSAAPAA